MSKISTIYDALTTAIEGVFPAHTRLPNPYKPEQNIAHFLVKSWGLAFTSLTNTNQLTGCEISLSRNFNVVLTRKYVALESDVDRKASVEKDLFEDQFLLIKYLENNITINGVEGQILFVSDNGLEFVEAQNEKFLLLNSLLEVRYYEKLV